MKDRRLTQKQIDRLLANNPHKIELEIKEETKQTELKCVSFSGTDKDYDTLNTISKIKDFCNFIRDVNLRYEENLRLQEEAEMMENDIRHCIELAPKLTEKEKRYLYNKLTEILQTRRACKSENEILQPLYSYFNDKVLLNKMTQIQGTVSNLKEIISNRTYSCRTTVLDDFRTEES